MKLSCVNNFDSHFNGPRVLVVKFGRGIGSKTPCPPCVALEPAFKTMEDTYKDFTFLSIEVEEFPGLTKKFNVKGLPTTIIFYKKHKMDTVVGNDPDSIKTLLEDCVEMIQA